MFESMAFSSCAVCTDATHGKVHAEALVTLGPECLQRALRRTLQVMAVGLLCICQWAAFMATLAFKVGNGMHAGRHGLITAYAMHFHTAQQQAYLGEAVEQTLQRHLVQFFMLVRDHRGFGHVLHADILMYRRLLRHPLAGQCQASIQTHAA